MAATWWTKSEELDQKQLTVISLPAEGSHLITGPAGCGKTNLLLLRAAYLHKSKISNVAVFTFGRVLREFLVAGSANYPFSREKIQTYLRWGASLLNENGISFDEKGEFEKVRASLLEKLRDLAAKKLTRNIYDCILLDEAQDYSEEEIEVISSFADTIFAVGDSRQQITNMNGGLEKLKEMCDSHTILNDHYRNGRTICRLADGILNELDSEHGMEASSKYNEVEFESSVRVAGGLSIAAQAQSCVKEIQTQLTAYPGELIGILCPRQDELEGAWSVVSSSAIGAHCQIQRFMGGYTSFDPSKRVILTTIHGAKGLEFRALHLLGMDKITKFRTQKRMSYTAVTRCKTSLRIYHETDLPGYFEKGLSAVAGVSPAKPTVDDLFLKGSL
jgi:superfamily I DNA/RNA helicase